MLKKIKIFFEKKKQLMENTSYYKNMLDVFVHFRVVLGISVITIGVFMVILLAFYLHSKVETQWDITRVILDWLILQTPIRIVLFFLGGYAFLGRILLFLSKPIWYLVEPLVEDFVGVHYS